jgi:dolichol-phosphate mannosyltransferase
MVEISVVIPVLNEESLINELVERVKKNLEKITNEFEIIIVDDGSSDNTWNFLTKLIENEQRIKLIKFSRNFGHHYAITAGLHKTVGEWVVVMDGDFQDVPEVIPQLYTKAKEGFNVVFVSRQNRQNSFSYMIVQKIFYWVLNTLSGINFDPRQANFSIINRKVVEAYREFPEQARFYVSTIKWLGFSETYLLAQHGKRHSGKPSYTVRKRFKLASDIILSFSDRPLRIAIGLGVSMSAAAIINSLWIVYGKFNWGYSVTGWPSLISAVLFGTGVILIVNGILGIYIGEIFKQVKNRPLYIIDEKINFE